MQSLSSSSERHVRQSSALRSTPNRCSSEPFIRRPPNGHDHSKRWRPRSPHFRRKTNALRTRGQPSVGHCSKYRPRRSRRISICRPLKIRSHTTHTRSSSREVHCRSRSALRKMSNRSSAVKCLFILFYFEQVNQVGLPTTIGLTFHGLREDKKANEVVRELP